MKRSLVMLAQEYHPLKFHTANCYWSEKLDGVRALWVPETRGVPCDKVLFANRERDDRDHVSTGLWTRRGKPIFAPDWFIDQLPQRPLDGELFLGRGKFQSTTSIVRKLTPNDDDWKRLKYVLFDAPSYQMLYKCGEVNDGYNKFIPDCPVNLKQSKFFTPQRFNEVYKHLRELESENVRAAVQVQLSGNRVKADEEVVEIMTDLVAVGAEGIMLRRPHSIWEPRRSEDLVKVKPLDKDVGTIVGYSYGLGKLAGMFGAIWVEWREKTFKVSGFTDKERELNSEHYKLALKSPGKVTNEEAAIYFKLGDTIPFEYCGVSDDGIPRFPRYRRS